MSCWMCCTLLLYLVKIWIIYVWTALLSKKNKSIAAWWCIWMSSQPIYHILTRLFAIWLVAMKYITSIKIWNSTVVASEKSGCSLSLYIKLCYLTADNGRLYPQIHCAIIGINFMVTSQIANSCFQTNSSGSPSTLWRKVLVQPMPSMQPIMALLS